MKLFIHKIFFPFRIECRRREKALQCKPCEWIWEKFELDKIQNCPYTSCIDEDYCRNVDIKKEIKTIQLFSQRVKKNKRKYSSSITKISMMNNSWSLFDQIIFHRLIFIRKKNLCNFIITSFRMQNKNRTGNIPNRRNP